MKDEDALTCDFAEYYHILCWRDLPVELAATLAAGLRPCSRSYMHVAGVKADLTDSLLAVNHDLLAAVLKTLAGKKAKGVKQIAHDVIYGPAKKKEKYQLVDDFESAWSMRTRKG